MCLSIFINKVYFRVTLTNVRKYLQSLNSDNNEQLISVLSKKFIYI